jgi:hypothetical protein
VFWVPFSLAGLLLLAGAVDESLRYWRLHADGAITTAVVIDRRAGRGEAGGGSLTYRYAVPADGAALIREEPVNRARFEAYPPGASVPLRHWRQDPRLAEIDREGRMRIQMPAFIGLALFWNAVVGWAGWALVREARRMRRLRRAGTRISGRLVRVSVERDGDGDGVWVADYQFTTPGGRLLVGSQRAVRPDRRDSPPPPGTPVWVAYADDAHYHLL